MKSPPKNKSNPSCEWMAAMDFQDLMKHSVRKLTFYSSPFALPRCAEPVTVSGLI